jgi:SEL1 protein
MYTIPDISAYRISNPAETYVYDIVPVGNGLAAISSDDSLRFLDPLALENGPVHSVKKVNADVTCLSAFASEGGDVVVCTGGRDGRVVLLDPRNGSKVGEVRSGE